MSAGWGRGSTRLWRKRRAQVLARDGHRCQLRLPGCLGRADCVHHVRGRARTGDDPNQMVAACTPCNLAVGEPDADPEPRPTTRW